LVEWRPDVERNPRRPVDHFACVIVASVVSEVEVDRRVIVIALPDDGTTRCGEGVDVHRLERRVLAQDHRVGRQVGAKPA
jgi:hypothetical protein